MLSITDKISYRERQILIHSHIYYNLDKNRITDKLYDKLAYELVDMIKKYPEEFKQSEYSTTFEGFDGSTGFDLLDKLSDKQRHMVEQIASFLCRASKR